MKKSNAKWKIAVGHHTMRSVSHHGDTEELLQLLLPILKVTQKSEVTIIYPPKYKKGFFNNNFAPFQVNGIDFYINGHDHCLQHISSRNRLVSVYISYKS